jgi:MoxR-like ATPase
VRGAIDLARLGRGLADLRGEDDPAPGDATFADAAVAALSGRLRLDESCERTREAIVLELIAKLVPAHSEQEAADAGKAGGRPGPPRAAPADP